LYSTLLNNTNSFEEKELEEKHFKNLLFVRITRCRLRSKPFLICLNVFYDDVSSHLTVLSIFYSFGGAPEHLHILCGIVGLRLEPLLIFFERHAVLFLGFFKCRARVFA